MTTSIIIDLGAEDKAEIKVEEFPGGSYGPWFNVQLRMGTTKVSVHCATADQVRVFVPSFRSNAEAAEHVARNRRCPHGKPEDVCINCHPELVAGYPSQVPADFAAADAALGARLWAEHLAAHPCAPGCSCRGTAEVLT